MTIPTPYLNPRAESLEVQAKSLISALRRERAKCGLSGYDPARHRRLVDALRAMRSALPRNIRRQIPAK